ncbi:hypothetical protein HY090_01805 [Candidatus Kaiserbacteria bacterium]|nr:hypothetical protein [Candidatus Kaiserbacteria bacterium]
MTPRAWKRLFARIVLWSGIVTALVVLFFLASATWRVYTKEREVRSAHLDEAEELASLTARKDALTVQLDKLNTSRGIEEEVRDRYPVAKTGEEVIVLTDTPAASSENTASSSPPGFWASISGWFSWF